MKQPTKELAPDWEKILAVFDRPRQEIKMPVQGGLMMDGAWDLKAAQNSELVMRGIGVKTLSSDIGKSNAKVETPTAFLFVCKCGFIRRVVDSEVNFTCERPKDDRGDGCNIFWSKEVSPSTEKYNPETGDPLMEVVLEEMAAPSGRKYMLPRITGRYIHEVRREEFARRKARGEPETAQPGMEPSHEKAVREDYAARDAALKNRGPENA